MTAVLVTGSAGFLGSAVCALLLERGVKTIGVDPLQSGSTAYQSFADDLSDRRRITEYLTYYGVTHIIHCGGISSPQLGTPERIIVANTAGSINLALAACAAGVRRFVFASSISAADPKNAYGCSKAAAELALQALNQQNGTQFCTLRFAGIYGPGRSTPVLPHDLVAAALSKKLISVSARAVHAYVYIDDAAEAAVQACFAKDIGELPYTIVHTERVTALQLAEAIWKIIPSFHFDVSEENDGGIALQLDVTSASRNFGFNATIDHRSGIASLIEWMSSSEWKNRYAETA